MNEKLQTPIQFIKGVGPKRAELFQRIGVSTVEDFLWLLPRRYEDRSHFKPIGQIREGETLSVMGTIAATGVQVTRTRLNIFKAAVKDGTGVIYATFFNQPYLKDYFTMNSKVVLYGKATKFQGRQLMMNSPEFEILENEELNSIHMGGIVPIYPATENLGQKIIRSLARNVLLEYGGCVEEFVPTKINERLNLMEFKQALWNVHFPKSVEEKNQGRTKMVFNEFFLFQLSMALSKKYTENTKKGVSHDTDHELIKIFNLSLPFKLTAAQEKVLAEIREDMRSVKPMNRLLQGDVGSGKTIVAIHALVCAVGSGYQGVIMVPTEILARQHYGNIKKLVEPLGVRVGLLISDLPREEHNAVKKDIEEGKIDIIVGTHALIQEPVNYKKAGLIVIDEQHKFGVAQRARLGSKAKSGLEENYPDILVMTATPIPRSLALTLYGTMDISTIDELPPGRGKVVTYWITEEKLPKAYEFIRKEIAKGRQAYIVYPLVQESESLELRAAVEMAKKLQTEEFPKLRMGLIHGRMPSEEKIRVMQDFKDKKIHILVATTVIEVGIDIANATVLLVEHAERFGLAQLHQLRGRIGRGNLYSYCILQGNPGTMAGKQRLKAMEATTSGFKISQEDLTIRGPGEFFGTKQSGIPELRIGDIMTDMGIMETARTEAVELLKNDQSLQLPENKLLRERAGKILKDRMQFVNV